MTLEHDDARAALREEQSKHETGGSAADDAGVGPRALDVAIAVCHAAYLPAGAERRIDATECRCRVVGDSNTPPVMPPPAPGRPHRLILPTEAGERHAERRPHARIPRVPGDRLLQDLPGRLARDPRPGAVVKQRSTIRARSRGGLALISVTGGGWSLRMEDRSDTAVS